MIVLFDSGKRERERETEKEREREEKESGEKKKKRREVRRVHPPERTYRSNTIHS